MLEHDKQITRFDCASINCRIGWIESIGIGRVLFFEGLDNAIIFRIQTQNLLKNILSFDIY